MYLKAVDSQKNKVFVKKNWEKNGSSRLEVFLRKGALKICSRFTGEHQCRSVIPVKLQSNFIKIALWHGYSPVNLGSAKWLAQSAHVPYMFYVPYVLYMSYLPYVHTCPSIFYRPENSKMKILYPYVFKGTEFNSGP